MGFHLPIYAAAAKRLLAGRSLRFITALALLGCSRSKDRLEEMRIEEPAEYFTSEGFVEMVPPLRLPLRTWQNRVEVWLKIPNGSVMTLRLAATGPLLALPPNSIAARVESLSVGVESENVRFFAADVRGTRFGADAEHFFVLKPTANTLPAPLHGWSWRRDSTAEQALADERLAALVGATANPTDQEEQMRAVRATNACASCHEHARGENQQPNQYGNVNRGTDESGCFQVQGILSSELPIETYFPLEQNLDDPFITFWCGAERATIENRRVRCANGLVPRGRLAVRDGVLAADDHVLAVCRSRRYLHEHLPNAARSAFEQSFAECGIGSAEQNSRRR